jgi:hypothetical protein
VRREEETSRRVRKGAEDGVLSLDCAFSTMLFLFFMIKKSMKETHNIEQQPFLLLSASAYQRYDAPLREDILLLPLREE